MFGKRKSTGIPMSPTFLPPPPPAAKVRYRPLFSYVELLRGKELSDSEKEAVIVLAEAGIAPIWPPK